MDTIDPVGHDSVAIFILNAMSAQTADGDELFKKFNIPEYSGQLNYKPTVDIRLLVNGVEVDCLKSLKETMDRLLSGYERHIEEKAKELVTATRLDKLLSLLNEYEWQIENEINRLFPDN